MNKTKTLLVIIFIISALAAVFAGCGRNNPAGPAPVATRTSTIATKTPVITHTATAQAATPTRTMTPTWQATQAATPTSTWDGIPAPDPYEPDDSALSAKWINAGIPQYRSISPSNDSDWVKFNISVQSAASLETSAGSLGGDTVVYIYNSSGTLICSNDDKNGPADLYSLAGATLAPGLYYAEITSKNQLTEIGSYIITLSVEACTPTATATPTDTAADTFTITPTDTPEDTATVSPTFTPSPTGTDTATCTYTVTSTRTATQTVTPTITPTITPRSLDIVNSLDSHTDCYYAWPSDHTDDNNGSCTSMLIQSPDLTGYVKFDLSTIPVNATVVKAVLQVSPLYTSTFPTGFYAYRASAAWVEGTNCAATATGGGITCNNAPPGSGGSLCYATFTSPGTRLPFTLGSLAAVQSWVQNPAVNYGLLLSPSSSNNLDLAAYEGSGPNSTRLLVYYYAP